MFPNKEKTLTKEFFESLIGKIIGKYKILEIVHIPQKRAMFTLLKVECTRCGNISIMTYNTLKGLKRREKSNSTMCSHKVDNSLNREEINTKLIGKTIGRYTILEYYGRIKGKDCYICLCNICNCKTILDRHTINDQFRPRGNNPTGKKACSHKINFPEELIGKTFGKYKVLRILDVGNYKAAKIFLEVKCTKCGWIGPYRLDKLRLAESYQSGARCSHGVPWPEERLYETYRDMIRRCENPRDSQYNYYGGRGIQVVDEWRNGYQGKLNFINDAVSKGYTPGCQLTIDRLDSSGNYCPENTQWVSKKYNSIFTDASYIIRIKFLDFDKLFTVQGWSSFLGEGESYYSNNFPSSSYPDKLTRGMLITGDILSKLSNDIEHDSGKVLPGAMVELDVKKPKGDFNEDGEFVYKENCDPLQLIIDKEEKGDFDFDLSKLRKDNNNDDNED